MTALATASAQDKIVIEKKSSPTNAEYSIGQVRKITFEGNVMKTFFSDGTEASGIDLSDIKKIYFTDGSSSIASPSASKAGQVIYDGQTISLPEVKGTVPVAIFSINGTLVSKSNAWDGSNYDVSDLGKGIYIMKAGKIAVKFSKK